MTILTYPAGSPWASRGVDRCPTANTQLTIEAAIRRTCLPGSGMHVQRHAAIPVVTTLGDGAPMGGVSLSTMDDSAEG